MRFWDRPRTTGFPRSANGASSFHLRWLLPPGEPLVEVTAVLEVLGPPTVDRLYFWALQASFADGRSSAGAAHIGLQWNPRHPGGRAANWGGYRVGGGLLEGTASPLPSTPDDPNTRDFAWEARRAYQLRIAAAPGQTGCWRGTITDLATAEVTTVRDLMCGGDRLEGPVVWSEVFARCDDPSVTVRWSGLAGVTARGQPVRPRGLAVSYEPRPAGGCDNTTVRADSDGVLQVTNTARTVAPGAVVPVPPAPEPGAPA